MPNKPLTPRELFKLELIKRGLTIKTVPVETSETVPEIAQTVTKKAKTVTKKAKTVTKKAKTVTKTPKTDARDMLTEYIYPAKKKNRVNNSEYLKEWRKKNIDKCQAYREKLKKDQIRYQHQLEYDRNRPNKEARREANKIRNRERALIPEFSRYEKARSILRRKTLSALDRIKWEEEFAIAKKVWKEYCVKQKR